MQLMVFSKHLAGPPLDHVAERLRAMDIDAIDLTVRPGGHIAPERVEDDLPQAAEVFKGHGVRIGMLTTNITDADDPTAPKILRTAARLNIGFYKLGYYSYQGFGTLRKQRGEVAAKVKDLAALNQEVKIQGGFHNHSANIFGASLWDIEHVLQNVPHEAMGLYFDPAHATIEGGSQGWLQGMDLLQERIVMLAVKDYEWVEQGGYSGGRRFKVQWCPLEQGNVRWTQVLQHLRQTGYKGPVSLHSEYQGKSSFKDLSTDEVFEQTARDAVLFRKWIADSAA